MRKIMVVFFCMLLCSCSKTEDKKTYSDSIFMGTYEQDNNSENGEEKIEWTVLDEANGKKLIISTYTIDMMPIESSPGNRDCIDWADSEIRQWLNNEFLENHFTEKERKHILDTDIEYICGKSKDTFKKGTVTDKVFYLSYDEAIKYFNQCRDKLMGNGITDFAFYNTNAFARKKIKEGDAVNDNKMSGLVTRDKGETKFDDPDYRGFLFWAVCSYYKEDDVNRPAMTCVTVRTRTSVRPAMWISTEE